MNKTIFKVTGTIILILLFSLSVSSCYEEAVFLALTVDAPGDNATVTAPEITVSGSVNKSAIVKINDTAVTVKDSKFSYNVKLVEGKNEIKIAAQSGKDTVEKLVNVTYLPPK
jgi:hypothetical protein